jgi:ligand-binding SRPBCC domain-containing protein
VRLNALGDAKVAVFWDITLSRNNFNKFQYIAHRTPAFPHVFPHPRQLLSRFIGYHTMRFQILTRVQGNHRDVFLKFDHSLLLQLSPPGVHIKLLHIQEPSEPNAYIRLQVTILGIIRQNWENVFSHYELREDECHFVDEGRKMPFPIRYWRHDHRVLADGPDHAIINDDITFKTGFLPLDWLMYPILWLQFRYRQPIYRRVFGKG